MNTETFVAQTLVDIVNAVIRAQKAVAGTGGEVHGMKADDPKVEFDLALTVTESATRSGEGKITVWGANVGGARESVTGHEHVSRVRFAVDLALPRHGRAPDKKDKYASLE